MWCGRAFTPHATGGRAQRFCRSACRRAFDAAGRHWVAEAIAGGTLTLDSLRNAAAATRALLPGAVSTGSLSEPQKPAPIAPADSPGEAADLLDDFLIALLDLPGWSDPGSWLWNDVAAVLPDELFDRIDRWMEVRFAAI